MLDKAIMLGISRKSTIYKTLGVSADEALNGTSVFKYYRANEWSIYSQGS
jgi:dihydropteroate synthase